MSWEESETSTIELLAIQQDAETVGDCGSSPWKFFWI